MAKCFRPRVYFSLLVVMAGLCAAVGAHAQQPIISVDDAVVQRIFNKVLSNWPAAKVDENRKLQVSAKIELNSKGQLQRVYITKSSGNKGFDASLLQAVKASQPFGLPARSGNRFNEMEFIFRGQREGE